MAISGDQWRSVHLPIRIEVEEGRDVKDLSVAAAHRPLVRVHRVAAAVPSVDLDAHVLRPELLEIAQTRSTLRLQSQFFQSQLQSRWRDSQRTCSRPGTQPRS